MEYVGGEGFEYEFQNNYLLYRSTAKKINCILFAFAQDSQSVATLFCQILQAQSKFYLSELPTGTTAIEAPLEPEATAGLRNVVSSTAVLAVLLDHTASLTVDSLQTDPDTYAVLGYRDKAIEVLDSIHAAGAGGASYIILAKDSMISKLARDRYENECETIGSVALNMANDIHTALLPYKPATMRADEVPCFLVVGFKANATKGDTKGIFLIDWDILESEFLVYDYTDSKVFPMGSGDVAMEDWWSNTVPDEQWERKRIADWGRDCVEYAVNNTRTCGGVIESRVITKTGYFPFRYYGIKGADGYTKYYDE